MERRALLKTAIYAAGAIGVGYYAKRMVELTDEVFSPKYVLRGNSPPPPEDLIPWQRSTQWTSPRIVFIDGRKDVGH